MKRTKKKTRRKKYTVKQIPSKTYWNEKLIYAMNQILWSNFDFTKGILLHRFTFGKFILSWICFTFHWLCCAQLVLGNLFIILWLWIPNKFTIWSCVNTVLAPCYFTSAGKFLFLLVFFFSFLFLSTFEHKMRRNIWLGGSHHSVCFLFFSYQEKFCEARLWT